MDNKVTCEICGSIYKEKNKLQHIITTKHMNNSFPSKEEIERAVKKRMAAVDYTV